MGTPVQFAAVLCTLGAFALEEELLEECLGRLADMLDDTCYAARCCAAAVIPQLYSRWAEPQVCTAASQEPLCHAGCHCCTLVALRTYST